MRIVGETQEQTLPRPGETHPKPTNPPPNMVKPTQTQAQTHSNPFQALLNMVKPTQTQPKQSGAGTNIGTSNIGHLWQMVLSTECTSSAFLLVPKRFDVLDALRAGVSSLDLRSTRLWFQEPTFSAGKITKNVGHTGVPAQYEEQPLQQASQNHVCCSYVA